jgi:trehalose-6-phosphate synthase
MKEKLLKQLTNAYTKRVKQLNKNFTKASDTGLLIFVEQLKYLRDTIIIKCSGEQEELENDPSDAATSLVVALAEFDAYKNSTEKEQKEFHWNNFCEFIKLNLEEWLVLNDTI